MKKNNTKKYEWMQDSKDSYRCVWKKISDKFNEAKKINKPISIYIKGVDKQAA